MKNHQSTTGASRRRASTQHRATLAALAVVALVAAACGSSSSKDAASVAASAPAATTAAPSTTTAAPSEPGTIVDVAAANPDFSTLVAAVKKAGLADTLAGTGPFTVFAPTNEAFDTALAELKLTKAQLLASPDLKAILTYHVLPGKVMAADVTGKLMPATVQGEKLPVAPSGGGVAVGDATVVKADVAASNGVIHAIDRVLLPPTVAKALGVGA
jgi:uncharacterized surface protein with fasciclin (FAS1) repeats